jgi:hypothetical protein
MHQSTHFPSTKGAAINLPGCQPLPALEVCAGLIQALTGATAPRCQTAKPFADNIRRKPVVGVRRGQGGSCPQVSGGRQPAPAFIIVSACIGAVASACIGAVASACIGSSPQAAGVSPRLLLLLFPLVLVQLLPLVLAHPLKRRASARACFYYPSLVTLMDHIPI